VAVALLTAVNDLRSHPEASSTAVGAAAGVRQAAQWGSNSRVQGSADTDGTMGFNRRVEGSGQYQPQPQGRCRGRRAAASDAAYDNRHRCLQCKQRCWAAHALYKHPPHAHSLTHASINTYQTPACTTGDKHITVSSS
jgi:hypothetical protein